ncbi:MAG: glycerophosphodiester phosphodiesterase [Dehalococcoidia bacterium]|nr:glycerophosphodiester phosphodiesterase [Dehalococcoidia bacterium]
MMVAVETDRRPLIEPGRGAPALIAHKAGNTAVLALAAIEEVADYLEVDLYVNRGRFEARHEHRIFSRLPVLFEGLKLSLAPRRPFGLAELLEKTEGRVDIFLDLKNGGMTAARLVRKAIDESGYQHRLVASSQLWSVLRSLHDAAPEVDLFYSIGYQSQLDLFLSVIQRDTKPRGISCRHTLLSPRIIEILHERGLLVVAWTVDEPDRAAQLAEWGVDGITTHRVADLRQRLLPA